MSFDAETRLNYLLNRCSDLVRDYDRDFDKAMEEEEDMSNWHEGIQPLKNSSV